MCCWLGAALGCASGNAESAAAGPCEPGPHIGPGALYLGDGVTSYHYYPIVDFLRENPGSQAETLKEERSERAAAQSSRDLKPPSAGIVETEFSHLLGAIARDNGGTGAAVFDTTGLKVGASGLEMEGLVLPPDRLAMLRKAPEDPPVAVHYTCEKLRDLTRTCTRNVIYGPPCWPLDEYAKDCKAPITAYYRPVIDYDRHMHRVGFSMFIVQDRPCKDVPQSR